MALRSEEEINKKIDELRKTRDILDEFITRLDSGNHLKPKFKSELDSYTREINLLMWVLKDNGLPF